MKRFAKIIAIAGIIAFPAIAQHNHGASTPPAWQAPSPPAGHGMHGGHTQSAIPTDPASQAFAAAAAAMHRDMAITFTGNADADFARGMIPHHQGAINMAEIILKFGKDEEVRKLAMEIVAAQKAEIAQMQAWLRKNGTIPAGPKAQAAIAAYGKVNAEMHKNMDIALTRNPDLDFMAGMIPHHEGAVEMAKVLLRYGNDPELRKLAEDVVRSQSAEIVTMLGWLRRNGG